MQYTEQNYKSDLSSPNLADFVAFLYENPNASKSMLHAVVRNPRSIDPVLDRMINDGLLVMEVKTNTRLKYVLNLTEKGKKIGKLMVEARQIMFEE